MDPRSGAGMESGRGNQPVAPPLQAAGPGVGGLCQGGSNFTRRGA